MGLLLAARSYGSEPRMSIAQSLSPRPGVATDPPGKAEPQSQEAQTLRVAAIAAQRHGPIAIPCGELNMQVEPLTIATGGVSQMKWDAPPVEEGVSAFLKAFAKLAAREQLRRQRGSRLPGPGHSLSRACVGMVSDLPMSEIWATGC